MRLALANTSLAVGQFSLIAKDVERDPIPALLETIGVIAGTIPDQATLNKMQADEAKHGSEAKAAGGRDLPRPVRELMRRIARVMTRTAYRI